MSIGVKASAASIIFIIGWVLIGPLALTIVFPFLWQEGPSREKLPSANVAVLLPFLAGLVFNIWISNSFSEHEIWNYTHPIAEFRAIQTGASQAILDARVKAAYVFAAETLSGLLFLPVVFILIIRQGAYRYRLDQFYEKVYAAPKARPGLLSFFAAALFLLLICSPYFLYDADARYRRDWRAAYSRPILPIMLFFLASYIFRFWKSHEPHK